MKKDGRGARYAVIVAIGLSSLAGSARAAGVVEDFSTGGVLADKATFGSCNQLVARVTGQALIGISGGVAKLVATTTNAGAYLKAAAPLPEAPYKLHVSTEGWDGDFVVLAGLYDKHPGPGLHAKWEGHAALEIAAARDGELNRIYVAYWDGDDVVRSYDEQAQAWVRDSYVPALTYAPAGVAFDIAIERTKKHLKVTLSSGTAKLSVNAPLAKVRPTPGGATFIVGDPLTDWGEMSLVLDQLELPASSCGKTTPTQPTADAGIVPDAGLEPPPPAPDLGTTAPPPAATYDAGVSYPNGGGGWDLGVAGGAETGESGGCAVGGVGAVTPPLLGLLGLALFVVLRRRFPVGGPPLPYRKRTSDRPN